MLTKLRYMVMSRDQNSGQTIQINNSSFESVEQFKYLGRTFMNQNSIQEEIKSRMNSRTASSLLTKNTKNEIHRTIILPVACMGVKLGRHTEGVT
jgi:hypothetical protein